MGYNDAKLLSSEDKIPFSKVVLQFFTHSFHIADEIMTTFVLETWIFNSILWTTNDF